MEERAAQMKQRDTICDIIKGFAMILVVLGHTMTGCTTGSKESFLYNLIWSIQMPLFILISGYLTKYGNGVTSIESLKIFVIRMHR